MPIANSKVIPEAAQRLSGIHNHRTRNLAPLVIMDSGLADFVRAPELSVNGKIQCRLF